MKRIELTQGKFTIIDDDDFDRVSQFKWHAVKKESYNPPQFMAARSIRINGV